MPPESKLTLGTPSSLATSVNAGALSGLSLPTTAPTTYSATPFLTSIGAIKPAAPATSSVGTPTTYASAVTPASQGSTTGLASFLPPASTQTASGATISVNPDNTTYSPTSFNIDTDGVDTSNLAGGTSAGDVLAQRNTYADYVNGLAQAQQYSPAYVAALQAQQQAQAQASQISTNFYTGNPNLGDTVDYAQGETAKALQLNSQQQLAANQAMDVQSLLRSGNIAAAQTQLQDSPVGMSGADAISQYNALQQLYPGANIPSYNPSLTPEQNQQLASQLVANSGAYNAGFQSTYTTPGGGTGIYSKLNTAGLQQNSDGTITLVPAAAAALGTAQASVVGTQLTNLSNINSAIDASGKTISTMTQFMTQYGLNQSSVPIVNQITNSTNSQLNKAGAIAALKVDINTLRSDYAQFLIGRGGSIAGSNDEAANAVPDNLSPDQMNQLYSQMKQDGINTAGAISTQVNQALAGITNNTVGSTNGSTGSGGLYDF